MHKKKTLLFKNEFKISLLKKKIISIKFYISRTFYLKNEFQKKKLIKSLIF